MNKILFISQHEDEDSDSGRYQLTDVTSTTAQFFTTSHQDLSTFFRDGRRKIDFVLVYEEALTTSSIVGRRASLMVPPHPIHLQDKKMAKHENWRQRFMANLRKAGLDMEEVCFLNLTFHLIDIDIDISLLYILIKAFS